MFGKTRTIGVTISDNGSQNAKTSDKRTSRPKLDFIKLMSAPAKSIELPSWRAAKLGISFL